MEVLTMDRITRSLGRKCCSRSEWEGTLWDKPDWIDRYINVMGHPHHSEKKGSKRPLQEPRTYWEYNDVRANKFSFALMMAFGRPLPEILKERIMDPIGATQIGNGMVTQLLG